MKDASKLLDQLMSGDRSDLLNKAKETWDSQSMGTKGAMAGGLLAVLLGAGRGGLGSVAKVGGAAVIGGVAARAYADWKAGKPPLVAINDALGLPEGALVGALPPSDDLAARLLRAMIAAAKADGKVTDAERDRITAQMDTLGFEGDGRALIDEELSAPLDVTRIAALAHTEEEATQIYTASLLVLDRASATGKAYLETLAQELGLDEALSAHLNAQAEHLMLRA